MSSARKIFATALGVSAARNLNSLTVSTCGAGEGLRVRQIGASRDVVSKRHSLIDISTPSWNE
jgi:hypothetical protein